MRNISKAKCQWESVEEVEEREVKGQESQGCGESGSGEARAAAGWQEGVRGTSSWNFKVQ